MNPIFAAANELQVACTAALLKFCFIGGLAVQVAKGVGLRTCSAEDLVVHKVFAGRDKDWEDVRGIIGRQPALNTKVIWDELLPLLELREDVTSETKLRELLER